MQDEWLSNTSLPRLLRTENGTAVEGLSLNITITSSTELLLEPQSPLAPGMNYQVSINPGYTATDDEVMEDGVIVDFTTVN